ncbi:ABC transporter permease [Rhizobium leguminosarum]|uniref:ABC transporter permease n=1 Tax=Rhizobium leguminosarum TaxID=384 RepID=UPI001C948E68|nr:ABC transporter permease [Rhizobium leguminosarum]MBY5537725.1 ABC transporter permease [Rhizobium leguminosarum]
MRWLPVAINRLLWLFPTLVALLAFVFILSRVVPIDPAVLAAGENATPSQIEQVRERYGFNQPLPWQFLLYLRDVAGGDLGISLYTHQSIAQDLAARLPATVELTMVSMLIAALVGIPLGVVCGVRRNSWLDHVVRVVTVAGIALTHFWIAIQLQLLFSMKFDWLPLSGRIDGFPPNSVTGLLVIDALLARDGQALVSAVRHLSLPALTLGLPAAATVQRFTRNSVLNFIDAPSVSYQIAMGIPRRVVIWKYVLRMSLAATVTLIGLTAGVMLAGAVAVETVFDWPGLGNYAVQSILYSDYNAVMGFTLLAGGLFALLNVLVDILQVVIDPREEW